MTGQNQKTSELYEVFRELGALALCRHDFNRTGLTVSAVMTPVGIPPAARRLYKEGYFLEDLSALEAKEGFLVTYHFDSFRNPGRVALRALADEELSLVSIADIYQGAEWHEREASDFFGLEFLGNPNPVPLLLPEIFPGPPPLLKEPSRLANLADLGIFGETEVIDAGWVAIITPVGQKEEGAA